MLPRPTLRHLARTPRAATPRRTCESDRQYWRCQASGPTAQLSTSSSPHVQQLAGGGVGAGAAGGRAVQAGAPLLTEGQAAAARAQAKDERTGAVDAYEHRRGSLPWPAGGWQHCAATVCSWAGPHTLTTGASMSTRPRWCSCQSATAVKNLHRGAGSHATLASSQAGLAGCPPCCAAHNTQEADPAGPVPAHFVLLPTGVATSGFIFTFSSGTENPNACGQRWMRHAGVPWPAHQADRAKQSHHQGQPKSCKQAEYSAGGMPKTCAAQTSTLLRATDPLPRRTSSYTKPQRG